MADRDSIYTLLESIKNGRLTCTKYSGTTLRFERPHIVVFANWTPQIELISRDRWNIKEIKNKKLTPYVANDFEDRFNVIKEDPLEAFTEKQPKDTKKDILSMSNMDFIKYVRSLGYDI
jgi:hypothetical protein